MKNDIKSKIETLFRDFGLKATIAEHAPDVIAVEFTTAALETDLDLIKTFCTKNNLSIGVKKMYFMNDDNVRAAPKRTSKCCGARIEGSLSDGMLVGSCEKCGKNVVRINPKTGAEEDLSEHGFNAHYDSQ